MVMVIGAPRNLKFEKRYSKQKFDHKSKSEACLEDVQKKQAHKMQMNRSPKARKATNAYPSIYTTKLD